MKTIQWFTSALLVSAMAIPCAMAQGFYEGNGAANLPSQRIVNEAPGGTGAALTLSPATVRRVQQELNRLGYNDVAHLEVGFDEWKRRGGEVAEVQQKR